MATITPIQLVADAAREVEICTAMLDAAVERFGPDGGSVSILRRQLVDAVSEHEAAQDVLRAQLSVSGTELAGIVVVTARGIGDETRTVRLGRRCGQTPRDVLDEYYRPTITVADDGASFVGRGETGEVVISGTLSYEDAPS